MDTQLQAGRHAVPSLQICVLCSICNAELIYSNILVSSLNQWRSEHQHVFIRPVELMLVGVYPFLLSSDPAQILGLSAS